MRIRNRSGFTLIEIAIVLTIVGLLIGGIWLAAATVLENKKRNDFASEMLQTLVNTETLFAYNGHNFKPLFPAAQFFYAAFNLGEHGLKPLLHHGLDHSSSNHGPLSGTIIPVATAAAAALPADGFDNTTAIAAGLIPSDLITADGHLHNPYASDLTQDSLNFIGAGNTIQIIIGSANPALGIPSAACVAVATKVMTSHNNLRISSIIVNGSVLNSLATTSDVAIDCNGVGNTNTIEFDMTV